MALENAADYLAHFYGFGAPSFCFHLYFAFEIIFDCYVMNICLNWISTLVKNVYLKMLWKERKIRIADFLLVV
jgi:hypothetical protein